MATYYSTAVAGLQSAPPKVKAPGCADSIAYCEYEFDTAVTYAASDVIDLFYIPENSICVDLFVTMDAIATAVSADIGVSGGTVDAYTAAAPHNFVTSPAFKLTAGRLVRPATTKKLIQLTFTTITTLSVDAGDILYASARFIQKS